VVLVPPPLTAQWREELRRRFLLGAELDTSLLVVTTDDPGGFSAIAQAAGMIVIDEAHHLTSMMRLGEQPREFHGFYCYRQRRCCGMS
jgi:ATP-dependent helicase HepA